MRYPPLGFDLDREERWGEGVDLKVYQALLNFVKALIEFDQFFAAEFRLHTRAISWSEGSLTLATTEEISRTLSEHEVDIQLALNRVFQTEVHLNLEVLPPNDTRLEIETILDHIKRKRALQALREVDEASHAPLIQRCIEEMGGNVFYVIPRSLTVDQIESR